MTRIETVSPVTEKAALQYLASAPPDTVYLDYLLRFDLGAATRNRIFIGFDDGVVTGVAYFGRQIAIACEPHAAAAFAREARRHAGDRMIFGPRASVEAFWERARAWHEPPRAVRERQFIMTLERGALRPFERSVTVRHARPDEWTAVADNSARMIAGELDYDPRGRAAGFSANVRAMIDDRLWWVGESLGRLCFFCNVGPWSSQTAQLQGIWTPPKYRRRGLATAALSAVCERLLEDVPQLSLCVNDFNEAAIALYRRIGFETVSEYKTLLF